MTTSASSLRRRIFLGTFVALTLVVAFGCVAVWFAAQALLYRGLDHDVQERAHTMLARVSGRPDPSRPPRPRPGDRRPGDGLSPSVPDRSRFGANAEAPPEVRSDAGSVFIQIVNSDGEEMARSPSLASDESLYELLPGDHTTSRIYAAALRDHRPVRVLIERLPPSHPGSWPPWLTMHPTPNMRSRPFQILVAIDASPVITDLQRLALVLGSLWLVTTALGLAVALWLHRTILRPLTTVSQGIAALGPDDLRARLSTENVPREMQIVPQRLNELLTRLENAFLREKSTLSNIAHELRTPVTGLRMTIELALAEEVSPAHKTTLTTCLHITESMQAMIANLLTLSKLDAGDQRLPTGECALDETARTVWSQHAARAAERGLRITWQPSDEVTVRLTTEQVHMVIGNVFDNAVSYAAKNSTITVSKNISDGMVGFTVENTTETDIGDLSQVFVPFWRGDQARTGGLHCGLGLALVQRLLTALGGRVDVGASTTRTFRITAWMPLKLLS